jgi:hypothetical protein
LRGQGDQQDGRRFAFEEKGREGQHQHRDDQGEDRQPIGAAADPALEAEKDLLQFHRILARGLLSGALIGRYGGRFGSKRVPSASVARMSAATSGVVVYPRWGGIDLDFF